MKRIVLVLAIGCGGEPVDAPVASLFETTLLSETGLFEDISTQAVDARAHEYEPAYKLWSDGAQKRRWIRTPDGSQPDDWSLPIGARMFKQFAVDGRPIETRVFSRESEDEWFMGTFVWRDDLSDADLIEDGVSDANGKGYEVPNNTACRLCHGSTPRTLGWSPEQLAAEIDRTDPIMEGLGYLHANCGHCHGDGGLAMSAGIDMVLRLDLIDGKLDATRILESTVGRPAITSVGPEIRIAKGRPDQSAIIYRMKSLDGARMPPIATHTIDEQGVLQVSRMIEALQ